MKAALIILASVCLPAANSSPEPPAKDHEPIGAVLARVPPKARAKRNPLENDAQALLGGRKLFDQHCAECHGESGDGTRRAPGLRGALLDQASDGEIFWIMTNGVLRHGMPAWGKLPEPQRWQIVAFLRSMKVPASEPTENPR